MKKTLLFLFTIITCLSYSQSPINNYFSLPASEFAIVSQTVDQSATGANAVWSFGTLTQTGTNTDAFAAPTAGELTSYPGTTQVLTTNDGTENSQVFYKVIGATLSLTGASNPGFTLDYNTDNALVGTYPLTYGNAATNDAIAGTITAQGQSPDYTGTINTEVDAYGTLSFSVTGLGSYSGNVTRIKTDQMANFTIGGFFPGTATLTNYNYYKNTDGALVFRTSDGTISVPDLAINESFSSTEALITNTLSVADNMIVDNSIKLYPNPVDAILNIKLNTSFTMQSVKIMDINGKIILSSEGHVDTINVSQLATGFYIMTITTNKGFVTRKFIKK